MSPLVDVHRGKLTELCRRLKVRRLAVFGSAVRADFRPESDVDLLVEFSDVDAPGYADRFIEFAQSAESILGRPVDLLTIRSLRNPYLRRRVEEEAVEIHAA